MAWLQQCLAWAQAHPGLAAGLILAFGFIDCLFLAGLFMPSMPVLFGIGALVALKGMAFWHAIELAALGGWAGDLISFGIGRRYGEALFRRPFFASRQALVQRGRDFFKRYGGTGVFMAQFLGPLRPMMPAMAGAYGLSLVRFLAATAIASQLWALLYIVPGVVFGASLSIASEVASRLAMLVVSALVLVILLVWLARVTVGALQVRARQWTMAVLNWSREHRELGRLGGWLADPDQPETPGLALLALLLLTLSALLLWLWWGGLGARHPLGVDALAYQSLRTLYTPPGVAIAVAVAQLGEWRVYIPVAVAAALALAALRRMQAASHWLAAVGFAALIALGLSLVLPLPDPLQYFRGEAFARFSGRDIVLATAVYGFMAVLLATERPPAQRAMIYSTTAGLIGLIAAAQMYLGEQWLSIGLFAIVIGAVWVSLLGVGYRMHGAEAVPGRRFLLPVMAVFFIAAGVNWSAGFRDRLAALTPVPALRVQEKADWLREGYARLPAFRIDMADVPKQPLTVQWVGPLDRISAALQQDGWQAVEPFAWSSALLWLARGPIAGLPVVPQVHGGRYQALVMRKPVDDEHQWLLRLWPTSWRIGGEPLWLGSVTGQRAVVLFSLLEIPETLPDYSGPLRTLTPPSSGFETHRVQRDAQSSAAHWGGELWLIAPASP